LVNSGKLVSQKKTDVDNLKINVHIENFETGKVVATTNGKDLYDPMTKQAI
jgi:hypothetical protein